ncbi:MAG TPA: hypothetical protein VIF57_05340 [Polyangia bacterium]|jgi:hypothetical protein
MKLLWFAAAAATLIWSNVAAANTRICVSVQQKSWYKPGSWAAPPAAPAPAPSAPPAAVGPQQQRSAKPPQPGFEDIEPPQEAPFGGGSARSDARHAAPPPGAGDGVRPPQAPAGAHEIDPTLHLRRMLEYEVTHEPGFAAVDERCEQRLTVELYQLESGWTVFARYSGTEREEKVDHAELDEFPQLAQRIAFALLRNRPITQTITRENVLRADSETNLRTIDGTGHLIFGMGTATRIASLPTAQGQSAPVASELRILTPISIQAGYRRKLRAWGLDAFGRLNIGTENTGVHNNEMGGHVDYSWSGLLGLHFLHYTDAPGINSLYFGGGAAFEIATFDVIKPLASQGVNARDTLTGGGLNIDLLVGYEFLRASSVHFFCQVEVDAPAYILKTENDSGSINTYMPGAMAQIGVIF